MKIATWNVNSLRVRLSHLLTWLQEMQPDIVALQETKLSDENFPSRPLQEAGYSFVFSGQRTYNGVAILSRHPAQQVIKDFPGWEDTQRRLLAAYINDIRIINVYVPNGESISSVKYQYKLSWLNKFDEFLRPELRQHQKVIVMGDFNIAPENIDVHDPVAWEGKVLCSGPEREAFRQVTEVGLIDCFRQHHPTVAAYSWWDYRMNAFRRNLGLRIDHILASENLAQKCINCQIEKGMRSWERPSDHAPVVAEFSPLS